MLAATALSVLLVWATVEALLLRVIGGPFPARRLLSRWVRANRRMRMPRRVAGSGDAHTELTINRER